MPDSRCWPVGALPAILKERLQRGCYICNSYNRVTDILSHNVAKEGSRSNRNIWEEIDPYMFVFVIH